MDQQYISLTEIYITDRHLFKSKNLKNFLTAHSVPELAVRKIKGKLHISLEWVKKNLPSFKTSLPDVAVIGSRAGEDEFFEIKSTLAAIGGKYFNPITLNFDSTHIKYFSHSTSRIPYFTKKGLIKVKMFLNNYDDSIFAWIDELERGQLKEDRHNLQNVKEMLLCKFPPVLKNTPKGSVVVSSDNVFDVSLDDVIVNFKSIGNLRQELKVSTLKGMDQLASKYRCPLYAKLQEEFQAKMKELKIKHENQIKDLKQEKIVHTLEQELEKEKSLKIQALTLTQSFVPNDVVGRSGRVPGFAVVERSHSTRSETSPTVEKPHAHAKTSLKASKIL